MIRTTTSRPALRLVTEADAVPLLPNLERARLRHLGQLPAPRNPLPGSKAHRAQERKRLSGEVESRREYDAHQAERRQRRRLFTEER